MTNLLDAIRARNIWAGKAIEEQHDGDIPIKMSVCDIEYLLNLVDEQQARLDAAAELVSTWRGVASTTGNEAQRLTCWTCANQLVTVLEKESTK